MKSNFKIFFLALALLFSGLSLRAVFSCDDCKAVIVPAVVYGSGINNDVVNTPFVITDDRHDIITPKPQSGSRQFVFNDIPEEEFWAYLSERYDVSVVFNMDTGVTTWDIKKKAE